MTQIAEQSEVQRQLVAQLQAAQDELAATHHAAGVTAERERMAQEIHDTLAQGFTSIVMLAQTSAAELERGRDEAALARVGQIEQVARENLAEARALVAAFGPADLADATLAEALGRLVERFTQQTSVVITLAPGARFTAQDALADLGALIDELGLESPVLVGHSLGGNLSQAYGRAQPGRASGLIAVGTTWNTGPLGRGERFGLRMAAPLLRLIPGAKLPALMADASAVTPEAVESIRAIALASRTSHFVPGGA